MFNELTYFIDKDYCPTVALNYNIFPSAVATNKGVSIKSF